jgi:hypothetical protein
MGGYNWKSGHKVKPESRNTSEMGETNRLIYECFPIHECRIALNYHRNKQE